MASWYKTVLARNGASLCLLRSTHLVCYQNEACKELCGTQAGGRCPQTCIRRVEKALGRPLDEEGLQLFPNTRMGKEFFDILFFSALPYRLVLFYPLERKHQRRLAGLQGRGLSRRENEIAGLRIQGLTNRAIRQKLGVSPATLKTHLNNIYKKTSRASLEQPPLLSLSEGPV